MVVDEWPDEPSFQAFWEAEQAAIGPLMGQVATGEPEIPILAQARNRDDASWE